MLLQCLFALAGGYTLGIFPRLPADDLLLPLTLLVACLAWFRAGRLPACYLGGFAAMWLAAWLVIDDRLEPRFAGETLSVAVRIVEFPTPRDVTLRFDAEPVDRPDLPARIRLSWFEADEVPALGDVWRLRMRLRRPHGYANPDAFDYEGWLFQRRIGATGYVVAHAQNARLETYTAPAVAKFRRAFVERVSALLPDDDAAAVVLAISVGARHRISREQWERYARTGTIHLMAISGLHIGLAASGVFLLAWAILAPLCRATNLRDVALLAAIAAAAVYASVSGWAIPAQRALMMALLTAIVVIARRQLPLAVLLAAPCIALFLSNPLVILTPGFKLSFAAVAIIFWILQRQRVRRAARVARWLRAGGNYLHGLTLLQLALLAGLFPLTTLIFGRFSLVAPLTNLLVLPVFQFVTVPACLAGMLLQGALQPAGDRLLLIAHDSVRIASQVISLIGDTPFVSTRVSPLDGSAILLSLVPLLYVLLPPGWPARKLAWLALAATLLQRPPGPAPGCLALQVLDVGQGLSVVLRTENYVALFDTGPAFRSGSNTAELVVIPYLQSRGIRQLNTLIVSHADQDHAGGVASIARRFPIGEIYAGEAAPHPGIEALACHSGVRWSVDGVAHFRFLHPGPGQRWRGNNASCVLEVSVGKHRLLLTGDIESPVEARLVTSGQLRPVDTVIVPHHGSRTSSSPAFVARLAPGLAIVSAGYGNRWGFPEPAIVKRWQDAGASVLETATSGSVGQQICLADGPRGPSSERRDRRRYWYD
ncbi:MAG: DNA internalization-related competence protein ComEC/Rec2 [Woeseiaceae bacterium]|nr:DNA internalization-related competence protein ComEC/Rec2 [Woeseiaceae bacterium]